MQFFGFEMAFSEDVYVPREDTYLMVRAIREEIEEEDRVLDMGTGSGILALIASEVCEQVVGVDINESAVELAEKNASANGLENIEFIKSDLFQDVDGEFDLIVFNAPYLPPSESHEGLIGSEQWLGGESGTEIVSRFSDEAMNHLSEDGKILLMVSSLTGLDDVMTILEDGGFVSEVEDEEKIPWETLYVVKASKTG